MDMSSVIYGWEKQYGLPDFVKQASSEQLDVKDFPDVTRSEVWLSTVKAHYTLSGEELQEKLSHLRKVAESMGLDVLYETDRISEIFRKEGYSQSLDDAYALDGWGPVRTPEEWDKASEWLDMYWADLPRQQSKTLAEKLIEKAAAFHKLIPDDLFQYARQGLVDTVILESELKKRAKLTGSNDFDLLIESVQKTSEPISFISSPADVEEILTGFDTEHGLRNFYDTRLMPPHKVAYSLPRPQAEKLAESVCVLTNGSVYEKDDLKDLSIQKLSEAFGPELANLMSDPFGAVDTDKVTEIVTTLPRPDADIFDQLMGKKACLMKITVNDETLNVLPDLS